MTSSKLHLKDLSKHLAVFKEGITDLISEAELTEKLKKSLSTGKPLKIKYGVDPSTPDIHLGHTVPLFKLRALQDLGHEVLFLIGDFTARIGDPSDRSEARKMLTKRQVDTNAKTYAGQVFKILDKQKTKLVYNSKWLDPLTSEEFLKLTALTTVHRMIERDDFKKRFDQKKPISLMEFLYPLLQGYDSVELQSDIEIGGTDQKFNLLMGRELQRNYGQTPQIVMTLPILEGTDGVQKMSKSLGNDIGINLPPNEMFGKVMSLPDTLIVPFYRYTTVLDEAAVVDIEKRLKAGENPRQFKAELGTAVVSFYYNAQAAEKASQQFDKQFRDKEIPDDIESTVIQGNFPDNRATILQISQEAVKSLKLSGTELRRLVKQGAVKVNGKTVKDILETFDVTRELVVQYGKRQFRKFQPKS